MMQPLDDEPKELSYHFEELRRRLFRSFLIFIISFAVSIPFSTDILEFILNFTKETFSQIHAQLIVTNVMDRFWILFKTSTIVGITISLPWILGEVLMFILPGLRNNEKKAFKLIFFFVPFLFYFGFAFWIFLIFPKALQVLLTIGDSQELAASFLNLSELISFVLNLGLVFGLVFQLPVLLIGLVKFDIIDLSVLIEKRPYFVVGLAVLSAVITPTPDAITMISMFIPMWILFELSILFLKFQAKKT